MVKIIKTWKQPGKVTSRSDKTEGAEPLVSFIPVPFPFSSLGSVFHPSPRSERNGTEHERSEASGMT